MIEPETIEAVVQEKSRKAAQKTPFRRAQSAVSASVSVPVYRLAAHVRAHQLAPGVAKGAATKPPVKPGPLTMAE